MRAWLPCAGFVVAGAGLGLPALVYGCAGQSYGSCTDTGTCAGDDASTGGDSPVGSEGGVQHDGGGGGGDSATDGPPGDGPGISCDAAAAIVCSGTCVDKETDPSNCGMCGHGCAGPEGGTGTGVCVNAACQVACEPEAGTTLLCPSGDCVDPTTTSNCGTCGNACPGPEAGPGHPVCQPGGTCVVACDSDAGDGGPTELLCSGSCVSSTAITSCGNCSTVCPAPTANGVASCSGSPLACGFNCTTGYHPSGGTACNATCTANTDDPSGDPCVVADGLGTFVSATNGSDTSPGNGTKEHPYATIAYAMGQAAGGTKRVYACGAFTAPVAVVAADDGVTVYGGFSCTTWAYSAATPTTVAPTAPGYALEVSGLTTGVTFEDFAFTAASASATQSSSPASSIAVFVNASPLTLTRVAVTAGSGQPGVGGATGSNYSGATAQGGSNGEILVPGGGGGAACGQGTSTGGTGGNFAGTVSATPGSANGSTAGTGIAGLTGGTSCSPGGTGSDGSPASGSGAGVMLSGTTSAGGWANGGTGGTGGTGAPAQGGGGGGANQDATNGGSGGGGGAGGCGGAAGTGGQTGGSSIGVLSFQSNLTLVTTTISTAAGGSGGSGGGAQGGQGGGGAGAGDDHACAGGAGGNGGAGSAGGGGAGGLSSGIVWAGTSGQAPSFGGATYTTQATVAGITLGTQGSGGGNGATPAANAIFQSN